MKTHMLYIVMLQCHGLLKLKLRYGLYYMDMLVQLVKKKLEIIVVGTVVAVLLGRLSPAWRDLYSEHFAFSREMRSVLE